MDCFGTYFTHFTYVLQPGVGWGGGVGCNDMHCTCRHVRCYAIVLAHIFDATQLYLRTCSMLRDCTCAHVGCYAFALAHMLDATHLHLRPCSMLRHCTWAHIRCYANSRKAFYTYGAKAWNTVARALKMKCYQCSHQKKIFAIDMKRKPRGLSKKKGTQTIDRAWLSLKRFLPKEANKKKVKGMFADVRELLEERVKQLTWRAELLRVNPHCPSSSSSNTYSRGVLKKVRDELVSSGLDFTKMGYRLSFYIKMSVLFTGASWRADQVVSNFGDRKSGPLPNTRNMVCKLGLLTITDWDDPPSKDQVKGARIWGLFVRPGHLRCEGIITYIPP